MMMTMTMGMLTIIMMIMMIMMMMMMKMYQTRKAHFARRQPGKKSTRGSTTWNPILLKKPPGIQTGLKVGQDNDDDYRDDNINNDDNDDGDEEEDDDDDGDEDEDDDDDDDDQLDHVDGGKDNPVAKPLQIIFWIFCHCCLSS